MMKSILIAISLCALLKTSTASEQCIRSCEECTAAPAGSKPFNVNVGGTQHTSYVTYTSTGANSGSYEISGWQFVGTFTTEQQRQFVQTLEESISTGTNGFQRPATTTTYTFEVVVNGVPKVLENERELEKVIESTTTTTNYIYTVSINGVQTFTVRVTFTRTGSTGTLVIGGWNSITSLTNDQKKAFFTQFLAFLQNGNAGFTIPSGVSITYRLQGFSQTFTTLQQFTIFFQKTTGYTVQVGGGGVGLNFKVHFVSVGSNAYRIDAWSSIASMTKYQQSQTYVAILNYLNDCKNKINSGSEVTIVIDNERMDMVDFIRQLDLLKARANGKIEATLAIPGTNYKLELFDSRYIGHYIYGWQHILALNAVGQKRALEYITQKFHSGFGGLSAQKLRSMSFTLVGGATSGKSFDDLMRRLTFRATGKGKLDVGEGSWVPVCRPPPAYRNRMHYTQPDGRKGVTNWSPWTKTFQHWWQHMDASFPAWMKEEGQRRQG